MKTKVIDLPNNNLRSDQMLPSYIITQFYDRDNNFITIKGNGYYDINNIIEKMYNYPLVIFRYRYFKEIKLLSELSGKKVKPFRDIYIGSRKKYKFDNIYYYITLVKYNTKSKQLSDCFSNQLDQYLSLAAKDNQTKYRLVIERCNKYSRKFYLYDSFRKFPKCYPNKLKNLLNDLEHYRIEDYFN